MGHRQKYVFDNPGNVKRVLNVLYISCAILLLLDFVVNRHTIHDWENLWGFYGIYGFVSCVALVLVAKWLRVLVMRPVTYYDSKELIDEEKDLNVDD